MLLITLRHVPVLGNITLKFISYKPKNRFFQSQSKYLLILLTIFGYSLQTLVKYLNRQLYIRILTYHLSLKGIY